jgi:hypothetical protein
MSARSSSDTGPSPRSSFAFWQGETGAALAALIASLTIMLIALGAAAPAWHHVVQDEREQQLIFNGWEFVLALRRHKKINNGGLPGVVDNLVAAKFLRRPYLDPITLADPKLKGAWHFIREGRPEIGCAAVPGAPGVPTASGGAGQGEQPQPLQPQPQPGGGEEIGGGPIAGVRSQSKDESIRILLGKNHYNEWCFSISSQGGIPDNVTSVDQLLGVQPGQAPPQFKSEYENYRRREWGEK